MTNILLFCILFEIKNFCLSFADTATSAAQGIFVNLMIIVAIPLKRELDSLQM